MSAQRVTSPVRRLVVSRLGADARQVTRAEILAQMSLQPRRSDEASEAWVTDHRALADLALARFLESGEWPDFDSLQRSLDRNGVVDEITAAALSMPTLITWNPHDRVFRIPLHVARYIPAAQPVLAACLRIILRTAALYFSDDNSELKLHAADPELAKYLGANNELTDRAIALIWTSPPHPFNQISVDAGGWSSTIEGAVARRLQGVQDFGGYVEVQRQILREADEAQARLFPTAVRLSADSPSHGDHMTALDGPIFFSHASADQPLADLVRDTLVLAGVPAGRLFYSSDRATGIPSGQDVGTYLRETLRGSALVIDLISPTFLKRPMCLMELGGAWAMGLPTYPVVVPPLTRPAATAAVGNVQMGVLGSDREIADVFNELYDRLTSHIGLRLALRQWNGAVDRFRDRVGAVLTAMQAAEDLAAATIPEQQTRPASSGKVSFSNVSVSDGRFGKQLHAEATNNDSVEHSATVKVTFYDAAGRIVGTENGVVNQLAPGETKTLTIDGVPQHSRNRLQVDTLL